MYKLKIVFIQMSWTGLGAAGPCNRQKQFHHVIYFFSV